MRVNDEQLWSQQLAEMNADEPSRLFRDFLAAWADSADRVLGEVCPEDVDRLELRAALASAFEATEHKLGFISVEWLGQMLLLIVQHWVYGDELWESLSVWERRMVEQATVLKLAELQQFAADGADPDVTCDTP